MDANGKENATILIVDDNPHLLKGQARILERAGYCVFQAATGEEGLELALKHGPDLVLHDVMLPGIDGVEACKRIKAQTKGTYVMLLSALKTAPEEQAEGLDSGADGYIARPIANRELLARVRAMLRIKKAESELRKSEQRHRSIIENAGLGIVVIDKDGVIAAVNPAFCEMTGFEKDELVGNSAPYPFWPADSNAEANRHLETLLSKGRDYEETPMMKKDGTVFPASETASSVTDVDGDPEFFIDIVQDITEKKRAQEAMLRIRKLEALSSMVGGMAHDLNNLLAVIVGNIDLSSMDAPPGSDMEQSLDEARQACVIARDLIRQYLAFSENKKTEKLLGNIREVAYDAAKSFSAETGVKFEIHASDSLEQVKLDPHQMKTTFEALFANSVEAMDGKGMVTVRIENEEFRKTPPEPGLSTGKHVKISVRDTGRGISEKNLPRIFDPYFSTKDRGVTKGMGFGLAMAHAVVSNHDGSIRASSLPDEGAEFTILLPAAS